MQPPFDLWAEWQSSMDLTKQALKDATDSAYEAARAEAEYYAAKHKKGLEMRVAGEPVTYIQTVLKGAPEVNDLLFEYRRLSELHQVNKRAIEVYRDQTRMLYDQIKREMDGE